MPTSAEIARREEEPRMAPMPKAFMAVARMVPSLLALVRTTDFRSRPPVRCQMGGMVKMRLCQRAKITGSPVTGQGRLPRD